MSSLQYKGALVGIIITIFLALISGGMMWAYRAGVNAEKAACLQSQKDAVESAISSRREIDKRVKSMDEKSIDAELHSNEWMRHK